MKKSLVYVGVIIASLVCVWTIRADEYLITGRDRVNRGTTGSAIESGGEDLVLDPQVVGSISRSVFSVSTPVNLAALSTSPSDNNTVFVVDGIGSDWNRLIVRDTLRGSVRDTLSDRWLRINSVRLSKPAVGTVRIWQYGGGAEQNDSTRIWVTILPGMIEPKRGIFTTPANTQADIAINFSTVQSVIGSATNPSFVGVIGLRTRTQTDTSWSILHQYVFKADGVYMMDSPISIGPMTDCVVAVGVTAAPTEVIANMHIKTR